MKWMEYTFKSKVFRWEANPAFFLVRMPKKASAEIREISDGVTNGFGSLKVVARIGATTWRTSIFPDSKSGTFDLPLKAQVRKENNLAEGSVTTVSVEIIGF